MKITKRQLRKLIRESLGEKALTTPEDFRALKPGDNLSFNGKPIVVIGVSPMTGEVDYVDQGKATRKYFDYRLALADEPGEMPEYDVFYTSPGTPPQNTRLPRRMMREEIAVLTKDAIKDVVMSILSDEGGAAGLEPIEKALLDLENDDISLPEDPVEDIISDVPGVKRHEDGDFIDTTQLESMKSFKSLIRELVAEAAGQIICPNCGHVNSAGVDKCAKCGHPREKGNWKKKD